MSHVKLSICIPTYNFGAYIGDTLDSIVPQLKADMEVVIVDGASTDNTEEIVSSFVRKYEQVKYYRLEQKGGIDNDMAKAIDLATGDYCWLFSSDDIMHPDALDVVNREIKKGYDLYLCQHDNCNKNMKYINTHRVLNVRSSSVYDFRHVEVRKKYFALALTTEAFFSFMGGLIVKKQVWSMLKLNDKYVGSCWAHVARLFELMLTGFTMEYLPCSLLKKRGDNDSFRENGIVNRYRLAIDGYHQLGEDYFGKDSDEFYHIRRVIRNEFTIKHFLYAKLLCVINSDSEDKRVLDDIVKKSCSDLTVKNIVTYHLYESTPIWVCKIAKHIYQNWLIVNGRIVKE